MPGTEGTEVDEAASAASLSQGAKRHTMTVLHNLPHAATL